jgi:hypothetical protein
VDQQGRARSSGILKRSIVRGKEVHDASDVLRPGEAAESRPFVDQPLGFLGRVIAQPDLPHLGINDPRADRV